jgi:hypothetical protein
MPAFASSRRSAPWKSLLLAVCLWGLLGLGASLLTGCAGLRANAPRTPDQIVLTTGQSLDTVALTATKAYAADYVRRENAHKARGEKVKDGDWFAEKDELIKEAGRFNGAIAAYQKSYRAAVEAWLLVRKGKPTPDQLVEFSAALQSAQAELLRFFRPQP